MRVGISRDRAEIRLPDTADLSSFGEYPARDDEEHHDGSLEKV
jgi:hypothetical protein